MFPWDPAAAPGTPFSPGFVPSTQGGGRFDLPPTLGRVLYLAETPEHAIGERIQHLRGRVVEDPDLFAARYRLAITSCDLTSVLSDTVVDLCDPQTLARLDIRPDHTASAHRDVTQSIAAKVHTLGHAGLRWWSAFSGDWHTIAVFPERLTADLLFDPPVPLTPEHPLVRETAAVLGIRRAA